MKRGSRRCLSAGARNTHMETLRFGLKRELTEAALTPLLRRCEKSVSATNKLAAFFTKYAQINKAYAQSIKTLCNNSMNMGEENSVLSALLAKLRGLVLSEHDQVMAFSDSLEIDCIQPLNECRKKNEKQVALAIIEIKKLVKGLEAKMKASNKAEHAYWSASREHVVPSPRSTTIKMDFLDFLDAEKSQAVTLGPDPGRLEEQRLPKSSSRLMASFSNVYEVIRKTRKFSSANSQEDGIGSIDKLAMQRTSLSQAYSSEHTRAMEELTSNWFVVLESCERRRLQSSTDALRKLCVAQCSRYASGTYDTQIFSTQILKDQEFESSPRPELDLKGAPNVA